VRRLLVLTTLLGCALPISSARAADPIVVNQSARKVSALNGTLVYGREPHLKWECLRRVGGKVMRAHGLPRGCPGDLGVDRKGRVVLPFVRERVKHGTVVSASWHVYDVKSDRVRPLRGVPSGKCAATQVAIWGRRTAYSLGCSSPARNGLWVKDGKKTQRILDSTVLLEGFVLRGGTIAGAVDTGPGEGPYEIDQLMVGGKRCVRPIEGSRGNSENEELFRFWIVNGYFVWSSGYFIGGNAASGATSLARGLLTSKVPSQCATPGPNGRFEFNPETTFLTSFDLDGRQLYYSGYDAIRRHTLPAQPSYAPPPNDNFANAQSLAVGGPSTGGSTGNATTQPAEPLPAAKRSVWYTFTPSSSGTLWATIGLPRAGLQFGVYTGSSLATLTPVGGPSSSPEAIKFDVVAGKQYWIDVGSADMQADYSPFYMYVGTTPS